MLLAQLTEFHNMDAKKKKKEFAYGTENSSVLSSFLEWVCLICSHTTGRELWTEIVLWAEMSLLSGPDFKLQACLFVYRVEEFS